MWDKFRCGRKRTASYLNLDIGPITQFRPKQKRAILMLAITVDQKCMLKIQPQDSHGNVSPLDSVPGWTSSDETILTVTASDDGLTATIKPVGPIGGAQINVTADVKLGDEIKMLTGMLDVEVRGGEAVTLNIAADAPEDNV